MRLASVIISVLIAIFGGIDALATEPCPYQTASECVQWYQQKEIQNKPAGSAQSCMKVLSNEPTGLILIASMEPDLSAPIVNVWQPSDPGWHSQGEGLFLGFACIPQNKLVTSIGSYNFLSLCKFDQRSKRISGECEMISPSMVAGDSADISNMLFHLVD